MQNVSGSFPYRFLSCCRGRVYLISVFTEIECYLLKVNLHVTVLLDIMFSENINPLRILNCNILDVLLLLGVDEKIVACFQGANNRETFCTL